MVSVVIPCHNMGCFIAEALGSVQVQTFRDFEIIVVDDGSDDPDTIALLETFKHKGIRLIRTYNYGVAAARNLGVMNAVGKYILCLDSDDIIEPTYLEKAVNLLEKDQGICVVGCDAKLFGDASGVRIYPAFSIEHLLSENILHVSSIFRKRDWQAVGGYCPHMKFGWEDWEFWISMTRLGIGVKHIPEPLFCYRIRSDSRDHSMSICQKFWMLFLILSRHLSCYLRSPMSIFRLIENSGLKSERRP